MAEILSYSGNDGPQAVEDGAQSAVRFDFKAPKKVPRGFLGLLDSIHTSYARRLETYLAGVLRLGCSVRLEDIREQRFGAFIAGMGNNDVLSMASWTFDPEENCAPVFIQLSQPVALAMADRLMGGPGEQPEVRTDGYTDIELAILEKIKSNIAPMMQDAWKPFFETGFLYAGLKNSPRLVQELEDEDSVVVVTFGLGLQEVEGALGICLPGSALFFLCHKLEAQRRALERHANECTRQMLLANIKNSSLEVSARLDETQLMLKDLFTMKAGDVINLNKPIDSDAVLYIEGVPWFMGELGTNKQRMALKIKGTVKKRE